MSCLNIKTFFHFCQEYLTIFKINNTNKIARVEEKEMAEGLPRDYGKKILVITLICGLPLGVVLSAYGIYPPFAFIFALGFPFLLLNEALVIIYWEQLIGSLTKKMKLTFSRRKSQDK